MTRWFDWPGLVWRTRIGGLRVRIYPTGVAAYAAMLWVLGLLLHWEMPILIWVVSGSLDYAHLVQAVQATRWSPAAATVTAAAGISAGVVHELGHALGHTLAAAPAKSLVLGGQARLYGEPISRSAAEARMVALGPTAALAAGIVLALTAPAVTSAVGTAAVLVCGTALANFAPIGPRNSDGRRLWRLLCRSLTSSQPPA